MSALDLEFSSSSKDVLEMSDMLCVTLISIKKYHLKSFIFLTEDFY